MDVFLLWPGGKETKALLEEFSSRGHKVKYVVGLPGQELFFPTAVFHNHYDAWSGKPPAFGVDSKSFLPPSSKLIEEMSAVESVVMSMMNKRFDDLCVDERKYIYYKMIEYWQGVLGLFKPEAIIFGAVPHAIYDYILYSLAKHRGIKTILVEDTWISDRALLYGDYKESSFRMREAIKKNQGKKFSINDLNQDLKDHYFWQLKKNSNPQPGYMITQKNNLKKNKFWGIPYRGFANSIRNGSLTRTFVFFIKKSFLPNLRSEYKKLEQVPSLDKPYVYMPLCFQPERTSSPQGGVYTVMLFAIEVVASVLPPGWVLYVKEHPSQWMIRTKEAYSSARWRGYYKRLSELPNVRLVPIETSSFMLMEKSKAVAVVAGTAGWEAMLRKIPVINFGYTWYRDFKGIFNVNDAESCREALSKIVKGYRVTEVEVIGNLKNFDEGSIRGYIEGALENQSAFTHEEATRNLAKSIIEELEVITH